VLREIDRLRQDFLRMEALLQRTGTGLPVIVWQRNA